MSAFGSPERATVFLVAAAIGSTFLPSRKPDAPVKESPAASGARQGRIGLVFDVGGRGDKSFNDAAYAGLQKAERELGISAAFLEPTGSEDREAALRLFAARGMDLVIGVGFIFSNDVDAVAAAYPKVKFACVDYSPSPSGSPPNVTGLRFREEEGAFLVGAVAGLLSESHVVGFVGGMTIPLIRKFDAGYSAGVKAVCPGCEITSAYAGATPDAFKDPVKGKTLAISAMNRGADVLFHAAGATGHGVFEAVHDTADGKHMAIGVDADQYDEMPDSIVTSLVKRVDVAVFRAIDDAIHGNLTGGMRNYGLKEDGVDYVHEGPHAARIPEGVKAKVEELRARVVRGEITVPSE